MQETNFKDTRSKYEYHLEQFKTFTGSASQYCVENNLDQTKFSYYQIYPFKKDRKVFSKVKVKPQSIEATTADKMLVPANAIDPKWLAIFIHNLLLK